MSCKLSYEEQVEYGREAKELSISMNIPFINACELIVNSKDLPISPKTLANNYAARNKPTLTAHHSNTDSIYSPEEVIDELEKELEICKSKIKILENKNNLFLYTISKVVKPIDKYAIKRNSFHSFKSNSHSEIAMLDLSDIHLGKKIDDRDTGGICHYGRSVFESQCDMLVNAIQKIIEIQRSGGVDIRHLYINCLGDLIDGEMIYGGHQSEIFATTMDQIFVLGEYFLLNVLVPLGEMFETVSIFSVDGNHGRVGHKREGYDRKLNFDGILVRTWQQRLLEYQDVFKFYISESPFMIYSLFGKLHLLAHGNNSGNGRWPFLGMERFLTGVSMLNREVIDYLHLAHYHRDMKANFNFSEILVNGSWVGPTEFSVGKLSAGDFAFQRFYGVNPDHLTWNYPIYLDSHIKKTTRPHFGNEPVILTPIADQPERIQLNRHQE